MKSATSKAAALGAIIALVGTAGIGALQTSQAPAVKRNVVLKQDMTIPGREAVMAVVELPPGATEGKHTHPAEVFAFVQEGSLTLEIEGKPTETLKAGDHFYVAPGQVHQGTNNGSAPVKLVVVFVAEKGKPLTTQVP
jgi:quercetin dioxygenase-like cupin family protein